MDNIKDKVFKDDSISCKLKEFKTINRKIINLQSKCIILKHYYSDDLHDGISPIGIPLLLSNNIDVNEFIKDYITITSHLYDTIIIAINLYNCDDLIESDNFFPTLMECLGNYIALMFEYTQLVNNIKNWRKNGYGIATDLDAETDEKIIRTMHSIIKVIVNSQWEKEVEGLKYLKEFVVTQN